MKALIFAASALILNAVFTSQSAAHPPAYGPDGLIPHSHTEDGTTITGSVVVASHNDCPEATLPAILGVQTEGPCIRVNHGRPISHHVSAPEHEPVLIPTARLHQLPLVQAPPRVLIQPMPVYQPVVRTILRQPPVQAVPKVRPLPVIQTMPAVVQPLRYAPPTPIIMQGPATARVLGPELVTQFHHEGELLTVVNTHTSGLFGMTLMKVTDQRGTVEASWWTSRGGCFTRMAFLSQACWSSAGYHERFEQELVRTRLVVDGPGPARSKNPCDHYTRLEAILSNDQSGYCGY